MREAGGGETLRKKAIVTQEISYSMRVTNHSQFAGTCVKTSPHSLILLHAFFSREFRFIVVF